jgi:hypothetical protein
MFYDFFDTIIDLVSLSFISLGLYYVQRLAKHRSAAGMMLFSPFVLYKYLIFLIGIVVAFFALDVIADDILQNKEILTYGFDFALVSSSIGIMLVIRRVYEQVVTPQKEHVKHRLRKEIDEVTKMRMRYNEEQFREENK